MANKPLTATEIIQLRAKASNEFYNKEQAMRDSNKTKQCQGQYND